MNGDREEPGEPIGEYLPTGYIQRTIFDILEEQDRERADTPPPLGVNVSDNIKSYERLSE